jgi:exonuclease III
MAAANLNSVPHKLKQRLTVVSYNLHGLNQGSVGLQELICKLNPDVLMIQEHWLTPDNLIKLDSISPNYTVFGSSAMNERVCSGPLYGRPFGGTAILVNNAHISSTKCVISSDRYTAIKINNHLLITVYMPCVGTDQRDLICSDLLAELDALFISHSNCQFIIAGDFNTDLNSNTAASRTINKFITDNCLSRCDVVFPLANNQTYYNESTHCSSTIDYILTSHIDDVIAFNIIDLDINLSDHFPLMAVCNLNTDSTCS